jgi:metallo-beta-lactamase class B
MNRKLAVGFDGRPLALTDPLVGLYWFDSPAFSITADTHHLGSRQNSCVLITTPKGHILIETDFGNGSEYFLLADIINLGFNPKDIRYIILTHNHPDHVGGARRLREITGAKVMAHAEEADGIEEGEHPHIMETDGSAWDIPGCPVDIRLEGSEELKIGSKTINIIHTPGHTPGCITLAWDTEFDGHSYKAAISGICAVASLAAILDGKRDFPPGETPREFKESLKTLESLAVDIFLAVHQFCNDTWAKHRRLAKGEKPNPFIDPDGWKNWIRTMHDDIERMEKGIDIWKGKGWVSGIDFPVGILDPSEEPRRR